MQTAFKHNNYNLLAPFYDFLAGSIFGQKLKLAQNIFLSSIPLNSKVLVIGGGTGIFLPELIKRTQRIHFVDHSEKMVQLAKQRIRWFSPEMVFLTADVLEAPAASYDAIITFFFFDQFKMEKALALRAFLDTRTHAQTVWLVSDFCIKSTTSPFHKFLLQLMYWFFQRIAHLETDQLPDIAALMQQGGWYASQYHEIRKDFIFASVWRRNA
ncbi:MAG: class I SAM-dependent methyltransferase [Chitinophagales bacterium]